MNIGLIGYGGVGKAFVRLLKEKSIDCNLKFILKSNGGLIDSEGLDINSIIDNEDNIQSHCKWSSKLSFREIIDEEVDYLIELTPTNIETGEPALSYIREALSRGISVITGNKGPVLLEYDKLKKIADINKVHIGIGCTVGGALPSITSGIYDCAGSRIERIEGILNGTSNYILSAMESNKTFEEALNQAIDEGIAEKNCKLDVEGYDTAIKMSILCEVLMGRKISVDDIYVKGIESIKKEDVIKAKEEKKKIKLIGEVRTIGDEVKITVAPKLIQDSNPLFFVDGKNKGIKYKTDTLGEITIVGGASSPINAAAAILRDIFNIERVIV